MRLDKSHASSLMNIPYAVMFGTIFTFSFYLSPQTEFHVIPTISLENIPLFVTLLFYFYISWVTVNCLITKRDYTPIFIFSWIIAVWWLGVTLVMINSIAFYKYLLLASYITTVGAYDLFAYHNILYRTAVPSSIIWLILAGITIGFGFLLLMPTLLKLLGIVQIEINLREVALSIALIFLVIRTARLGWILKGDQV